MRIKGKYKGNKNVKLDIDLDLPIDHEVFIETGPKNEKEEKKQKDKDDEEHFLLQIAKHAVHFGRSDLSEKYHEILYSLEPEKDE